MQWETEKTWSSYPEQKHPTAETMVCRVPGWGDKGQKGCSAWWLPNCLILAFVARLSHFIEGPIGKGSGAFRQPEQFVKPLGHFGTMLHTPAERPWIMCSRYSLDPQSPWSISVWHQHKETLSGWSKQLKVWCKSLSSSQFLGRLPLNDEWEWPAWTPLLRHPGC